ncbi:type I restriction-modification system subunit M N-terminal domain-containing protein [Luteimonas chenhongjianii]|uniref:type I restriction-modification system subunit M N-terminal domain-containing protein n=1 Tax=Luteimonas chenhongjianii TaxID=2006110 RepID=UPI001C9E56F3|nr:type I restriction-modification system subunit M N-terminal domain-containing protein [Luteimonas chenhongjianii]
MLRDQGIGYGDYVEQITFLLFLKMDEERTELLGEPSAIPAKWRWAKVPITVALPGRHTAV